MSKLKWELLTNIDKTLEIPHELLHFQKFSFIMGFYLTKLLKILLKKICKWYKRTDVHKGWGLLGDVVLDELTESLSFWI